MVALMATGNSFANERELLFKVNEENAKEISFALNGVKRADVAIYDKFGREVYFDSLSGKSGIIKTFNFEALPQGNYILEFDSENQKERLEIVVYRGVVRFSKIK